MTKHAFDMAVALRDSGRIEEAIREFRLMAAEVSDANERAMLMLNEVNCHASLAQFDNAERVLEDIHKMSQLSPEFSICVSFAAARLSGSRGKHEHAAHQYASILREYRQLLNTPEYQTFREDICFRRAIQIASSGRFSEAIPLLQEVATFSTLGGEDHQEADLYLGICFSELKQVDLGKQAFLRVIAFSLITESEVQARYRLAVEYFRDGAFAQAKHQLETLLSGYKAEFSSVPLRYVYEQLSRACHYLGEAENERQYAAMSTRHSQT